MQGYQRYRADVTVPAELVVERIRRGLTPIAFAWRRHRAEGGPDPDQPWREPTQAS